MMKMYWNFTENGLQRLQTSRMILLWKSYIFTLNNDRVQNYHARHMILILFQNQMLAERDRYKRLSSERAAQETPLQLSKYLYGKHRETNPKPNNGYYNPEIRTEHSLPTLKISHSVEQMPLRPSHDQVDRTLLKAILKDSYSEQIKRQQQKRFSQQKLKIMQEKDYLSHFQSHKQLEKELNKKKREQYRDERLSQIKEKKILIQHTKTEENSLEKMYHHPRQNSLVNKSQAYRQFYEEAMRYQNRVAMDYKGYMEEEQNYKKAKNNLREIDFKQNLQKMAMLSKQTLRLQKDREKNMREILDEQVAKKQEQKKSSRRQSRYKKRLTEAYDPIVNPIDLKLDLNNKYINDQLIRASKKSLITQ